MHNNTPIVNVAPIKAHEEVDWDEMVQNAIDVVRNKKDDARNAREMLTNELQNDGKYVEKDNAVKKASDERKKEKTRVLSTPPGREADKRLQEAKEDVADAKDRLSLYLMEYAKKTGATEFTTTDGKVYQVLPAYQLKLI